MKQRFRLYLVGSILCLVTVRLAAEPSAAAIAAFNAYARTTEARLAQQHRSTATFLAAVDPQTAARLRNGELVLESLSPPAPQGALLHHWRGTAFVPKGRAADFERLLRAFNTYPRVYAPEVVQAKLLTEQGDHLTASMRVRQKHVITVVMDTAYAVDFARLDAGHGYSVSRSTHIDELDSADKPLSPTDEHGFLWRLNTYWSWEEADGGLYIQIESITLTRGIPHGLGWAVQPFVQSVPRESLDFTLRSSRDALPR